MAHGPLVLRGDSENDEEVQVEELDLTRSVSPADLLALENCEAAPSPPQPTASSSTQMRRPQLSRLHNSSRSTSDSSAAVDKSCGIRSIAFGTFYAPKHFAAEWAREGRGVDRMLLEKRKKDGAVVLVLRMWDEGSPFSQDATTGSSIRVSIEANTLNRCECSSGGTSLFLHLSRPPLFETFPPRPAGGLKPLARQVPYFDDSHAQVVGYSSRVLRVKLRSKQEYTAFLRQAEEAGLPRFVASHIDVDGSSRCGSTTLAMLQSWLLSLDVRVAFQLEKLVRNGLVDATKVLALRERVEALVAASDTSAVERVLSVFADKLGAFEPEEEPDSGIVLSDEENEPPRRPSIGKKRRRDSFSSLLSSSSADDDVEVVTPLPYARGLAVASPSELSVPELLSLFDRSADDAEQSHFLTQADPSRLVRQIAITPTRILLTGPYLADSNSVTRSYDRPQNFLSVSVRAEDGSPLRDREDYLLKTRFKALFANGLELAGRTFRFLAWSSSALKSASCFFMLPFEHDGHLVSPSYIHRSIGDFSGTPTSFIPAKYSARIAQAFSSTKPSVELASDQVLHIDDITSPSGSCFSDGVGCISPDLAADVVRALKIPLRAKQLPQTCFQFRMGGAKGMLQVDPALSGRTVALRPSQVKFRSTSTSLEIAGVFEAGNASLNRPLITLLECLGVPPERFLRLQEKATKKIRASRSTLKSAIKLAQDWGVAPSTNLLSTLSFLANAPAVASAAFSNPFISRCLDACVEHALREIKHSGRIPLPGCFNLVGVLDLDGVLEEGEIYARLQREDGSFEYLEGTIAISRSPTNHPGDLRCVRAVGRLDKSVGKRIRRLVNCVVFSAKGERSLPSMLAGGDLDGDVYLLLTPESGLIPSPDRIAEPAAYDPSPVVKLDREVDITDAADFFFEYITRDRTGLVATRQLHIADVWPESLFHPDCLRLAQLHSDCVDAAKSGHFVLSDEIPGVPLREGRPAWPDFLTNSSAESYRSPRALGQLYRAIGEDIFKPDAGATVQAGIDPLGALTSALFSLPISSLPRARLAKPSRSLILHYHTLLSSFSSELAKLAALTSSPRLANGRSAGLTEEELFLSITLGARRLDKAGKTAASRRREQTGELFTLARRLIRDGAASATATTPAAKVQNALAAWYAAVEEGEDREKQAARARKGGQERIGLQSFAWLALGVLVEQLQALEAEQKRVEELVLSP
ncbi:hypothetical protein JCM10213_000404 [Rhodosporidiobolus nylandii]